MILFLGSGVSLPTGLPAVGKLLELVLEGKWRKHTDEMFYPGEDEQPYKEDVVPSVQAFLRHLKAVADAEHSKRNIEPANYEDLFYLVVQISDQIQGWNRNCAIEPFLADLESIANRFPVRKGGYLNELSALAGFSQMLIQCAVQTALSTSKAPEGFDFALELATSSPLTIVTLNHDLLVERLLEESAIPFIDGFSEPDGDVRWADFQTFEGARISRILKLHGSIDWYSIDRKINSHWQKRVIQSRKHPSVAKTEKGEVVDDWAMTPLFLTGVGNKLGSYNSSIFAEMLFQFHAALKANNTMIMSGYGWGDRGINLRIVDWLTAADDRRLILLHANPDKLYERGTTFSLHRQRWLEQGKLIEIPKWLQDTKSADLGSVVTRV